MTKVRENASMGATSTGNIGTGAAGALFGGKTRTSEHVSGPNGKHEMSKMRSPTTPNKTMQQFVGESDPKDMGESIQAGSLIAPNGSVAKTAPTDKTKTGLPGKQQKMMPRGEMAGVHLINPNGVQRVKEDEMPEIPDFLRRPKPANPVDTSMLGMPSRRTSASAPTEEDHHVGDAIITALKDRGVNATVTYRPSYLQSSVGIYISVAGAEGEDDVSSRGPSRWIKGVLTASFPGYHIVQRRPGFSTVEYLIRKTDAMNAVECVDIKVDAIVEWTSPRGIGYRGQIVEIDGTRLTVKTGIGTMVIEADMVDDAETDDETTEE